MKTIRSRAIHTGLALLSWLPAGASAQQIGEHVPVGNVLYTVGTTFRSGSQDHAYLLWSPTDDDLLRLRAYSVWSKAGGPNSPAEYEPVSWIKVQTDPATIELTLQRAARLGQDISKLETAIDGLFEQVRPAVGVSRADKLSVIMQGAQNDPEMFHDLLVLSRLHPAVGLCMGAAYAGPINGLRTFEVRMAGPNDGPGAPDAVRRVVGRVTLDPAAYQALPAPGQPVPVPFGSWVGDMWIPDARANLNARMRWSTPDALRQQSLLQFGYQVYRIDPLFYQSQIQNSTLNPGDLAAYAQAFPKDVKRVSRHPVVIDKMFTASSAGDIASDPTTAFLVDSNGLGEPGAVPFEDGQSFYYMVTAVDILGRDGHASPARQITVYRTIPPSQVGSVEVEDYISYVNPAPGSPAGTLPVTHQRFRISWPPARPVPGVAIVGYEVYRWDDPKYISKPDPMHPPLLVATAPAAPRLVALDTTLGVPVPPPSKLGKVYWFTVRAVAESALTTLTPSPGPPKSPHSAPVSCVLRDRSTPPAPAEGLAQIRVSTGRITFSPQPVTTEDMPAPDNGFLNCRISLTRNSKAIDGIDCYCRINDTSATGETTQTPLGPAPANAQYVGSVRFTENGGQTNLPTLFRIPLPTNSGTHSVTFHLRARDRFGNLTGFIMGTVQVTDATYDKRHIIPYNIGFTYLDEVAGSTPPLKRHISRHADTDETLTPLIEVDSLPGQTTWKILRKIGEGKMELELEGKGGMGGGITNANPLAANAGEVSYWLQITHASGVPGPLKEIARFYTTGTEPPAKPMLLPPETLPNQKATLSWVCSPMQVERFYIGVACVGDEAPATISSQLSPTFETRTEQVKLDGKTNSLEFRIYDTGPLAGTSPEHSVTLDLAEGVTYRIFVQAISSTGERSVVSNALSFAWINPEDPGPLAPWPARPSAQINSAFGYPKADTLGIVIGQLPKNATATHFGNTWRITPQVDLMTKLYAEKSGAVEGEREYRKLLPCVVYRYQLPNTKFPKVSGNVTQVGPLIKGIAFRNEPIGGTDYTVVYDPYFSFDPLTKRIYLKPPQPLMENAKYRYLLVLIDDNGEIDSIVPTSTFLAEIN